jgi:hypothetical protein
MRREVAVTGAALITRPLMSPRNELMKGQTLITVAHHMGSHHAFKSVALNVEELEQHAQHVAERLAEARKELEN